MPDPTRPAGDYPRVEFDCGPRVGAVVNTGRTIQVNVDRGSGITIGGTRYELLQFHFHHPSEHTVGGVPFPWIVMTDPVTLSAAQIAAFGALYPRNCRPVQPLGQRTMGRDRG